MLKAAATPWLAGCGLGRMATGATGGWGPFVRSLRFQADRLGIACDGAPAASPERDHALRFDLVAPGARAVTATVHAWANGSHAIGGSEFLAQAGSGLMAVHGRSSGGSRALGLDCVGTATSALALQGAMAAALGQLRGASSTRVEVSLAGTALLCIGQYLAGATAPDAPERLSPGSHSPQDRPPFLSADGVVFEIESLDAEPWRNFWGALGIEPAVAAQGWKGFLLRYAKAVSPMPASMMQLLAGLPYADIVARCAQAGMAVCPVRPLAARAQDPGARDLWMQGPWRFSTNPGPPAVRPLPSPQSLPLSGLTIIESCRRIQGPLAGHLLALLGARVVRIEPPGGDPLRGMPPMAGEVSARFDALNRLKTVREIDIRTAAGRSAVLELARDADVFLHNWAPGKALELGLDDGDLHRVNPALVYAYAGGWGSEGPAPGLPGTDFMAQAYSGAASVVAQAAGTRGGSLFTVLDVLGGVVAAQGVTAALLRRQLSPSGCRVDTSLLGAATLLCARELQACWEGDDTATDCGPLLQAVIPVKDGQIAVECPDDAALGRLAEAAGLPRTASAAVVRGALPGWLGALTLGDAERLLSRIGVRAIAVAEDLALLPENPRLARALRPASYVQVQSPWRWS